MSQLLFSILPLTLAENTRIVQAGLPHVDAVAEVLMPIVNTIASNLMLKAPNSF